MGILATNKNLITLIYNSSSSLGKQTFAYTKTITKPIKFIDIFKDNITGTQWLEIVEELNINFSDLINTKHADFKNIYSSNKPILETTDWLKIIDKHPELLQHSILIKGKEFILINTPSDILKYIGPNSAGIEIP